MKTYIYIYISSEHFGYLYEICWTVKKNIRNSLYTLREKK